MRHIGKHRARERERGRERERDTERANGQQTATSNHTRHIRKMDELRRQTAFHPPIFAHAPPNLSLFPFVHPFQHAFHSFSAPPTHPLHRNSHLSPPSLVLFMLFVCPSLSFCLHSLLNLRKERGRKKRVTVYSHPPLPPSAAPPPPPPPASGLLIIRV